MGELISNIYNTGYSDSNMDEGRYYQTPYTTKRGGNDMKVSRRKVMITRLIVAVVVFCSVMTVSPLPGASVYASQYDYESLFNYMVSDGYATITGIKSESLLKSAVSGSSPTGTWDFIIPSEIGGYPVKMIGENAFEDVDFEYSNIVISEGIEILGYQAFYGAFAKSFSIPASVKEFTGREHFEYVFSYVRTCTAINVAAGNDFITSVDGVLFSKDKKVLYNYPIGKKDTLYTAPEETNYLACTSFGNAKNLKNVVFPSESAVVFMTYTFYGCDLTLYGTRESYDYWKETAEEYYLAGDIEYALIGSEPKEIVPTGVKLDVIQITMKPGETKKLTATVLPSDATDKTVDWSSSDSSIVSVDNNGNITAKRSGTATITAAASGCSGTGCSARCVVTVENETVVQNEPADTVKISYRVTYGQTEARSMLSMLNSFRAGDGSGAWYWNSTNSQKIWADSLEDLVYDYDLEKTAMMRAAEIGFYYAHERPNGLRGIESFSGSSRGENIAIGYKSAEEVFKAWREDQDDYSGQGHRRNMLNSSYTACAFGHAVVNGTHCWVQLFRSPAGSTTYTAPSNSEKVFTVGVSKDHLGTFELISSTKSISLKKGEKTQIPVFSTVIRNRTDYTTTCRILYNEPIIFSLEDSSIAEMDIQDGVIVAKKAGTTKITAYASFNGKDYTVEVPITVTAPPEEQVKTSISLNYTSKTLKAGEYFYLKATITSGNCSSGFVTWASSNSKVASVDSLGKVTGVSAGSATIYVTACGVTESCSITVYNNTASDTEKKYIRYRIRSDGTAEVTGYYYTSSGELYLPSTVPGEWADYADVVDVRAKCFKGVSGITKIRGGGRLFFISKSAFRNMKNLREIDLSEAHYLLTIGDNAFRGCTNLRDITINASSLNSVGNNAFKGVNGYVTVTIVMDYRNSRKEENVKTQLIRAGLKNANFRVKYN